MKKYSNKWLCLAGGILFAVLSVVDKFIIDIPIYIYIPVAVIGIVMIFLGAFFIKKGR